MDNKDLISFLDKWIDDANKSQEEHKNKKNFNDAFEAVGMQTAYLNVKSFLELNKMN